MVGEPAQNRPVLKFVNGKAVLQMPTLKTSEQALDEIKRQKGKHTVVHSGQKKISPFDHMTRDASDRWSKDDTQKFYKALQLMGTDFGMIETLFEGKRTRN